MADRDNILLCETKINLIFIISNANLKFIAYQKSKWLEFMYHRESRNIKVKAMIFCYLKLMNAFQKCLMKLVMKERMRNFLSFFFPIWNFAERKKSALEKLRDHFFISCSGMRCFLETSEISLGLVEKIFFLNINLNCLQESLNSCNIW